jgi:mannosyltransferase OCH1-like enzyme
MKAFEAGGWHLRDSTDSNINSNSDETMTMTIDDNLIKEVDSCALHRRSGKCNNDEPCATMMMTGGQHQNQHQNQQHQEQQQEQQHKGHIYHADRSRSTKITRSIMTSFMGFFFFFLLAIVILRLLETADTAATTATTATNIAATTNTMAATSSKTTEHIIALKEDQQNQNHHHRVPDQQDTDHENGQENGQDDTDQDQDTDHDETLVAILKSLQEITKSPPRGSIICPSPHLTPIYDKIVYPTTTTTTTGKSKSKKAINSEGEQQHQQKRKIPRIIHVSFNNRCIPNELAETITRWQEALPDHSLFFHDDEAVQRLVKGDDDDDHHDHDHNQSTWKSSGYFPELQNHIRCVKFKGAMLIDIWRMLISYEFGGLYTDIDNWPGPNMNSTAIHVDDSFFSLSDSKDRPSQWLFAMTPKHPIAIFTLQDISRRLLHIKNVARPRVVQITGPQPLKASYRKFQLLLEKNATIFGNSSYYNQIQKIDIPQSDQYAKGNLGGTYDEMIITDGSPLYDNIDNDNNNNISYTNITKREKLELVSGIPHWTEDVKLGHPKSNSKTILSSNNSTNLTSNNRILTSNDYNSSNSNSNNGDEDDKRLPPSYDDVSCTDYLAKLDDYERTNVVEKKNE